MFSLVDLVAKIMIFFGLQVFWENLKQKKEAGASFFVFSPNAFDYFTTSLTVLLKPLALMVQK